MQVHVQVDIVLGVNEFKIAKTREEFGITYLHGCILKHNMHITVLSIIYLGHSVASLALDLFWYPFSLYLIGRWIVDIWKDS